VTGCVDAIRLGEAEGDAEGLVEGEVDGLPEGDDDGLAEGEAEGSSVGRLLGDKEGIAEVSGRGSLIVLTIICSAPSWRNTSGSPPL